MHIWGEVHFNKRIFRLLLFRLFLEPGSHEQKMCNLKRKRKHFTYFKLQILKKTYYLTVLLINSITIIKSFIQPNNFYTVHTQSDRPLKPLKISIGTEAVFCLFCLLLSSFTLNMRTDTKSEFMLCANVMPIPTSLFCLFLAFPSFN